MAGGSHRAPLTHAPVSGQPPPISGVGWPLGCSGLSGALWLQTTSLEGGCGLSYLPN